MSLPSTPARSRLSSTSSTPSSSRSQAQADGAPLTPRSKVKAMLAALDDDDSDDTSPIKAPTRKHVDAVPTKDETAASTASEDDEDDDDLPTGKMAARLQGNNAVRHGDSGSVKLAAQRKSTPENTRSQRKSGSESESARASTTGENSPTKSQNPKKATVPSLRGKFMLRKKPQIVAHSSDEETGGAALPKMTETSQPIASTRPTESTPAERTPQKSTSRPSAASPASTAGGLFLSPIAPTTTIDSNPQQNGDDSDSDFPDLASRGRLLKLVEQKRAERRAREAEENKKREERAQRQSIEDLSGSEDDDVISARKLTQQSRPTRKASKKAIEEMNREQQRIQRNMQLSHQATVRKKIDKSNLLARFGYGKADADEPVKTVQPVSSTTCSSAPASDTDGKEARQTPLTSPVRPNDSSSKGKESTHGGPNQQSEVVIARMDLDSNEFGASDSFSHMYPEFDTSQTKGKGKAVAALPSEPASKPRNPTFKQRPIKIHPPSNPVAPARYYGVDSDSDLDIMPEGEKTAPKLDNKVLDKKSNVFDRLPANKLSGPNPSLLRLRALAQLNSSDDKRGNKTKASLSTGELSTSLQRRARQQAAKERIEKIKELEARGIIVQTAEERARDQAQVEDILDKARKEAEELKIKEKQEKRDNGEEVESSEDEDYEDEAEASADENSANEEIDVELSGSEDEADDEDEDIAQATGLFDNEAADSDNEEQDEVNNLLSRKEEPSTDDDEDLPVARSNRRTNHRVMEDDEEDNAGPSSKQALQIPEDYTRPINDNSGEVKNPFAAPGPFTPQTPQVQNPFALATKSNDAPLGLTQAFASTLSDDVPESQEQDSMQMLREMPVPDFPIDSAFTQEPQSQLQRSETMDSFQIDLNFQQSQIQDSMQQDSVPGFATQLSELPDPTQDVGFGAVSPVKDISTMRLPSSTIDTVIMPPVQVQQSPVAERKRGRLQRRRDAHVKRVAVFSDEEADSEDSQSEQETRKAPSDAFDVLKKSAKHAKAVEAYDRKRSKAKGMFEEQAEESEDEYAGLGGADGEDSDEEPDATLQQMIDESHVDVDERKLAAMFADKDRAADEAAVQKLFKDLQNGGLRRKRGADFDLDDSDDDAERRRARKRAEFARMRKALVDGDANVGKIAEDPKKKAFLRAIEDRAVDADLGDDDWLQEEDLDAGDQSTQEVPESQPPASQVENQDPNIIRTDMPAPDSASLKRKRPAVETTKANRRPFRQNKPTSLADLRATISSLTENPRDMSMSGSMFSSGESSADESSSRNNSHATRPRRTNRPVVDRLAVKRAESQQSATDTGAGAPRLAFHDANASNGAPGFKVPSLLRRATSSSLSISSTTDANGISHNVEKTERAIGEQKGEFFKKAGGKKSSVNFFTREEVRLKVLGESERRKEAGRRKIAGQRSGILGGVLGGGNWE